MPKRLLKACRRLASEVPQRTFLQISSPVVLRRSQSMEWMQLFLKLHSRSQWRKFPRMAARLMFRWPNMVRVQPRGAHVLTLRSISTSRTVDNRSQMRQRHQSQACSGRTNRRFFPRILGKSGVWGRTAIPDMPSKILKHPKEMEMDIFGSILHSESPEKP